MEFGICPRTLQDLKTVCRGSTQSSMLVTRDLRPSETLCRGSTQNAMEITLFVTDPIKTLDMCPKAI